MSVLITAACAHFISFINIVYHDLTIEMHLKELGVSDPSAFVFGRLSVVLFSSNFTISTASLNKLTCPGCSSFWLEKRLYLAKRNCFSKRLNTHITIKSYYFFGTPLKHVRHVFVDAILSFYSAWRSLFSWHVFYRNTHLTCCFTK